MIDMIRLWKENASHYQIRNELKNKKYNFVLTK